MLKKLYKHELYSLFRNLWPVYLGFLVLAIFARVSFLIPEDVNPLLDAAKGCIMMLYGISVIAVFALSIVVVITRFYKHLMTSEGYLTFTLPVSATDHLVCKLICGMLAFLASIVGLIFSGCIFSIGTDFIPRFFVGLFEVLGFFTEQYSLFMVILVILGLVLLGLLAIACFLLTIYTAISIGQQFKNRVGAAVLAYVCIYIANQMLVMIGFVPYFISVSQQVFTWDMYVSAYNGPPVAVMGMLGNFLIAGLIVQGIFGAGYFLVTRYLLNKKLNLE